ncbi:MAG: hypothetical protein ACP5I8_00375 [Phycisphaerae bacterium]
MMPVRNTLHQQAGRVTAPSNKASGRLCRGLRSVVMFSHCALGRHSVPSWRLCRWWNICFVPGPTPSDCGRASEMVREMAASDAGRNQKFSVCSLRFPTCASGFGVLLAAILTLTLAGCRNAPPATGIQGPARAVRSVKTWLAAGVGQYDGRLTGLLDYRQRVIPIIGHLNLINAYRFTLRMQSLDGRAAFILRRNWAGTHFIVPPSESYVSVARAIGEGVSLAFRRPEGPWTAHSHAAIIVVKYKDANANHFQWRLMRMGRSMVLQQARVRCCSGANVMITYTNVADHFPGGLTISDSQAHYLLRLQLRKRGRSPVMAVAP